MARSMLAYQEVPAALTSAATLVGLHGQGGDLDQLLPLASALERFQLVLPQAARPMSPSTQGQPQTADGFTWYFIQNVGCPEPATFGEGLWLVEQFIYDVRERQPDARPLLLLGFGQGAVVALTLATVLPDALAGVIAIGGYLPEIQGWSPPLDDLTKLPILLVHDPDDREVPPELIRRTVAELEERQAIVDERHVTGARRHPLVAVAQVSEWLDRAIVSA
jgi:predicted esterase